MGKLGVLDGYDKFGDHEPLGEGEHQAAFGGVGQQEDVKKVQIIK